MHIALKGYMRADRSPARSYLAFHWHSNRTTSDVTEEPGALKKTEMDGLQESPSNAVEHVKHSNKVRNDTFSHFTRESLVTCFSLKTFKDFER